MGIYIKEMDMPKSCIECLLHGESACKAFTTIEPWTFKDDERAAFCPLIEVPEPKWIPCSERLPSEDGFYIATCDGEICGEEQPFTGFAEFENRKWVDDEDDYQCVLAWMPLPEPYKGGDEE